MTVRWWPVSRDDREELMVEAGERCAICGETAGGPAERKLAVDHCHASMLVRGVLCQPCNVGLGGFRDRPELLRAAIGYLTEAQVALADELGTIPNRRAMAAYRSMPSPADRL